MLLDNDLEQQSPALPDTPLRRIGRGSQTEDRVVPAASGRAPIPHRETRAALLPGMTTIAANFREL